MYELYYDARIHKRQEFPKLFLTNNHPFNLKNVNYKANVTEMYLQIPLDPILGAPSVKHCSRQQSKCSAH
jgi:hypothetical protein